MIRDLTTKAKAGFYQFGRFSPSAKVLDGAYWAVSTRKVVSSYSGNALNVRVGSVEADVAFDSSDEVSLSSPITVTSGSSSATTLGALTTGNLDAFVTIWYNQGSSQINAFQATTSLQPKIIASGVLQLNSNGDTSLLFDNHQHYMVCDDAVFRMQTSAAYGYSEHNDGSYGGGFTHILGQYVNGVEGRGGLGSGGFGHVAVFITSTGDTLAVRDRTSTGGHFDAASTVNPTIASFFKPPTQTGTAKWLQADTVIGKPTSGFSTEVTDTFDVVPQVLDTGVGGNTTGLAAKWDGFITEIIVMDGTFSESDWEAGFSEINDKYGVYS
jgi:hypothetical protein